MTWQQAVEHFFNSDAYGEKSKQKDNEGSSLRNNKFRHSKGKLGKDSAVAMLIRYGYEVTEKTIVKAPKKKK